MTTVRLALVAPVLAALTACGTTVKLLPESLDCPVLEARLAQTVRLCNKAVAEHLQTLRELNQASQAGR